MRLNRKLRRALLARSVTRKLALAPHASFDAARGLDGRVLGEQIIGWRDARVGDVADCIARQLRRQRAETVVDDVRRAEGPLFKLEEEGRAAIIAAEDAFIAARSAARIEAHETNLAEFQNDNLLVREPELRDPLMGLARILGAYTAHTALDALVFQDVTTTGAIGAVGLAASVGAAPALLGLTVGFVGLRYSHHVSPWRALAGRTVCIVGLLALAGVLALAGTLRFAADLAQQQALAIDQVVRDHGGVLTLWLAEPSAPLQTSQGMVLILGGVVCFATTASDGFAHITDRYPGYGALGWAVTRARALVEAAAEAFKSDVGAVAIWAGQEAIARELALSQVGRRLLQRIGAAVEVLNHGGERQDDIAQAALTAAQDYDERTRRHGGRGGASTVVSASPVPLLTSFDAVVAEATVKRVVDAAGAESRAVCDRIRRFGDAVLGRHGLAPLQPKPLPPTAPPLTSEGYAYVNT